jgi:hypothetical protein
LSGFVSTSPNAAGSRSAPSASRRGARERDSAGHDQLHERLHVVEQDAALVAAAPHAAEIHAELARELAHRRDWHAPR